MSQEECFHVFPVLFMELSAEQTFGTEPCFTVRERPTVSELLVDTRVLPKSPRCLSVGHIACYLVREMQMD